VSSVMQWVALRRPVGSEISVARPRVRLAANLAIDRQRDQPRAETLGHSLLTNSIIPNTFDYFWAPPPPQYDRAPPKKAPGAEGRNIRTDWTPVTTRSMPRPVAIGETGRQLAPGRRHST